VATPHSKPHTHRRGQAAPCTAGAMCGWSDPGIAGLRERDADRVVDAPALHLLVADQPRQDRQSGGIGRSPAIGSGRRWAQAPSRARVGVPGRGAAGPGPKREGAIELEEQAAATLQHDYVAVAIGAPAALDWRAERDREGSGVAFIAIGGVANR